MAIVNRLIGVVIDGLLWPFRGLPAWVGLAFMSLLTAVGVLLVYRAVSDQDGITAVRRAIVAAILEMRLFRDDLVVVFRAQGRVLRHSLRYLRYSLVPLAWLTVPLILLVVQLQHVYGYRPLAAGETAIVRVALAEDADATLEASSGVGVETPALRIPALGEVNWRIAALEPGEHVLTVQVGERRLTKSVSAGGPGRPIAPERPSNRILHQLLHPRERPLPAGSPAHSISVSYPDESVTLLGWRVHWVVPFLLFTIVFGFALQRPLRVRL